MNFSRLRTKINELWLGQELIQEITHEDPGLYSDFMSKFPAHAFKRLEWRIEHANLHVRRVWDYVEDKLGFYKLAPDKPGAIRLQGRGVRSIRAAAASYRRRTGRIIECKEGGDGFTYVMLTGIDPVPDDIRPTVEETTVTPSQFSAMAAEVRTRVYRWPVDAIDVGGEIRISHEEEPRSVNVRAYFHYHGQRLGRKFEVRKGPMGHRITRTA